jgi:hypothetical protein
MAIASGTINSATPASALRTAIEGVFTAHSNWTAVEMVSLSSVDHYVYKNHGTGVTDNNSLGSDFYFCIAHATAGTGSLTFRTFEDYNAGSDLMIRPVMEDTSNATNADTSGLATGGVVLNTASGCMTVSAIPATAPNTSDYYIVASKNALHLMLRRSDSASVYSLYAGLFSSFVTIANEFPLCMGSNVAGNTNISTNMFGTSRHPGRISQAASTSQFAHALSGLTPRTGDTANVDLWRGKAQASKALLSSIVYQTPTSVPTFGGLRGTLYDVSIIPAASGVTLGMGDTLDDIDTFDHWYSGYGGQACWVNKSAV